MHTYGDACEMTEMTKSPLSGVGEIAKKLVAVRLLDTALTIYRI